MHSTATSVTSIRKGNGHMNTNSKTALLPVLLVALLAPVFAGGCISYFRQSRDYFDFQAKPEMVRQQVLNPEAGKNRKVVAGLDGPAAAVVNESYVKGFDRQTPTKATEAFVGLSGISN
jgi:hypothetical protein